jgi:type II secretory pathway pseudopilin PulG
MVELLVVITMIAIIAALLLPALANGSMQDQAIQCMNNCNQLARAWTMYASDNKDACVNNFGTVQVDYDSAHGIYNSWCVNIMDWTTNPQNTNTSLLQKGPLGPYMGASISSYKCPADNYLSSAQIAAGFQARVRSYSMNEFLGHLSDCSTCGNGSPGSGSDTTYSGVNTFNPPWPQYLTLASIPQPANIYVFLDEHPCSINDGLFIDGTQTLPSDPSPWEGSDIPASTHNGAGGISFSDGHSEIHKWQNKGTVIPVVPGSPPLTPSLGNPINYVDRIWLEGHACVK